MKIQNCTQWLRNAALMVCALAVVTESRAQEVSPEIQAALQSGDTTRAITLLNAAIATDPAYNVNYAMLGKIHFARELYAEARDQFLTALDKKKKDPDAQYFLGLCYLRLEDLDRALAIMDEGLKRFKEQKGRFSNGYGLVLMAQKKYSEADKAFRQAQVTDPENPEYHINLGDANFFQGVPSLAVQEYEKALASDTGSLEVYFHWADACIEMKDYNCAIEKLSYVLRKDSTHAPAWVRAASIYFKAGLATQARTDRADRFKEAIGAYRRYFQLTNASPDSSTVRPFFEMAMAYNNLGANDSAAYYFDRVLNIPFEPKDIYLNYGKALIALKQFDSAAYILDKHMAWVTRQGADYVSSTSPAEINLILGDAYFYRDPHDFEKALQFYTLAYQADTTQKRLLENMALSYHQIKDYRHALEFYERRVVQGVDSSKSNILKNAGSVALILAGGSNAEEETAANDTTSAGLDSVVAVAAPLDKAEYYRIGTAHLEEYLKYNPTDARVLTLLGSTYLYQMKDCQNGVRTYEALLKADPANCDAKRALGFAYFGELCAKNYSRALDYLLDAYNCAVRAKGACGDKELVLWIAQAYHLRAADKRLAKEDANSDFKNAYEWYGKVLGCDPKNAGAIKGQNDTKFEFN